jgi:thiosulfate/3-mercaptopyruvate sulfurtransferase
MPTALVTTEALAAQPQWRVFDCRYDLVKPDLGEHQYREAHIPGALYAHLERDLSTLKTGRNGRHPLPEPTAFIAWLGLQGLKPTDQVVCYDGGGGAMAAARLWWMLRWIGHETVAVLDGGLAKWRAEGRPVTAELPRFEKSNYQVKNPLPAISVDVSEVEKHGKGMLLLDARAPERYRGEKEPIDPVAGHIPGARNRYNVENLTADGTFKDAAMLRRDFLQTLGERPPWEVVHYCGSGVSACHNLLAMEVAGLTGGKLYAGSWSEWSSDPKRPVGR